MSESEEKLNNLDKDSSNSEESLSLEQQSKVDSQIDQLVDAIHVTDGKRDLVRHTIRELFVAITERPSGSNITPEVATILAASADKDNDNKFSFLSQKQTDDAAAEQRADSFREKKHTTSIGIIKSVLYFVLLLVAGCTVVGIYLCYIGKETLGAAILTGIFSAVFGYLAGLGTSDIFKDKD